jgi:hypothetical protein
MLEDAGDAIGSFSGSVQLTVANSGAVSVVTGQKVFVSVYYGATTPVAPVSVLVDGNEVAVTGKLVDNISGSVAQSLFMWIADRTADIEVDVQWGAGDEPGACAAQATAHSGLGAPTNFGAAGANSADANVVIDSAADETVLVFGITGEAAEVFTPDAGTTVENDDIATNATWCRCLTMSKAGAAPNVDVGGDYAASGAGWRWIGASFEPEAAGAEPFGAEGYVPTVSNPATAADAEVKHVDDILDTDYVPTVSNPATAADAEWKQVSALTSADFVAMVDDPLAPTVGDWVDGDERTLEAAPLPVAEGDTVLIDETFDSYADFAEMRDGPNWQSSATGDAAITGPETDGWDAAGGKALRLDAPVGLDSGVAGQYNAVEWTGTTVALSRILLHLTIKPSNPFNGHETGTNKYAWPRPSDSPNALYLCLWGSGNNALHLGVGVQGATVENIGQASPDPNAELTRGQWHEVLVEVIGNSAGNADGSIKGWRKIDGAWVQIFERTAIQITTNDCVFDSQPFMYSFIWGGTGDPPPVQSVLSSILCGKLRVTGDAVP